MQAVLFTRLKELRSCLLLWLAEPRDPPLQRICNQRLGIKQAALQRKMQKQK